PTSCASSGCVRDIASRQPCGRDRILTSAARGEGEGAVNARRGRAVTLVVVLATVVAVVVAAGWFFREPIAERMLAGLDETHVGTVGPDGFDETYDHSRAGRDARLRVMVPPGAAPEGTEVRVRVVSDRTRLGVEVPEGLLQATGLSADIELDGGALQPAEPV